MLCSYILGKAYGNSIASMHSTCYWLSSYCTVPAGSPYQNMAKPISSELLNTLLSNSSITEENVKGLYREDLFVHYKILLRKSSYSLWPNHFSLTRQSCFSAFTQIKQQTWIPKYFHIHCDSLSLSQTEPGSFKSSFQLGPNLWDSRFYFVLPKFSKESC